MIISNVTGSCSTDPDYCTDLAYSVEGYTPLAIGQTTITETFPSVTTDDWVFSNFYIQNLVDANPFIGIGWTLTAKTSTSFTVKIDASPDTVNYQARWKIKLVQTQL